MNIYYAPENPENVSSARGPMDSFIAKLARFILGGIFVYSGLHNIVNFSETASNLVLPGAAAFLLFAALFKILAGTALAFRYHTKYAALSLAIYLFISSVLLYGPQYWSEFDIYRYIFMRNIAVGAGLLFIASYSRGARMWQEVWLKRSNRKVMNKVTEYENRKNRP